MSGTALANARIEVVPFLALAQGGRLFDHNRNAGDLDNYAIDVARLRDLAQRPERVRAAGGPARARRLVFDADFTQHRDGVLAPGGEVSIVYAQSRLHGCRNTQNGYQLWDITAHVQFEPGQPAARGVSVRDGAPTITVPTRRAPRVGVVRERRARPAAISGTRTTATTTCSTRATPPQWVGNARR